jgi:parvulin-like peptidyl-prolyl isomerase
VDAQSNKAARRRRRTPQRRIAPIVEERERRPFLFGRGHDLTHRERESIKERIALFAGIALALVIGGLLGWGVLYDNVIKPNQVASQNNQPIAAIGTGSQQYVIRTGFFKRFEQFRYNNLSNQISQLQQQSVSLKGTQLTQANQQIQQLQSALNTISTDSLNELTDDQIAIQRGPVVGIRPTAAAQNAAIRQFYPQVGGPKHFILYVQQSGLSMDEFRWLLLGSYMQGKIQTKLQSEVKRTQLQVRASHILVKTQALANQILNELKHGASFAALAKKYSTDASNKNKGGDLGYFPKGQMVAAFEKVAFSLKVGQLGIAHSSFGWHVIKVTGRGLKPLSIQAYQQAQSSAYVSWLTQQKAGRVQNFVNPASLPAIPTPTGVPGAAPTSPPAIATAIARPTVNVTPPATTHTSTTTHKGKTK